MDWKNAEDYAYTDQLDHIGCGWEFLRRNADYIEDYQEYLKDKEENPSSKADKPFLFHSLPPESAETEQGWRRECILSRERPERYSAETWYGRKWGLRKIIHPDIPFNSKDAKIEFIFEWPKTIQHFDQIDNFFYAPDEQDTPYVPLENLGLIVFDISIPIKAQVKKAEKLLLRRQKSQKSAKKIDPIAPKEHQNRWKEYLRILDAKGSNPPAKHSEIANVLFKEKCSSLADLNDKVKKAYKQAINQTERYRNILYRSATIQKKSI